MKMETIVQCLELKFKEYISRENVDQRVLELGADIRADYQDKNPLFIGILNGAFMFTADLVRACNIDCELSFIKLSSYAGLTTTGKVTTLLGLDTEVEGRHVIVVEDIVDTGSTLHSFMETLRAKNPASISLAAFLVKPDAIQYHMDIDYFGYEIPNKFVIGYGLDYKGAGRHLRGIYQLVNENEA